MQEKPHACVIYLAMAAVAVMAFLASACGKSPQLSEREEEVSLEEKTADIVRRMTPAEKAGQMLMIGVQGTEVTDDSRYMLQQYHIGGVILFDRNMESAEQAKALTEGLQQAAGGKVPLFIGTDEEGGEVVRGAGFIQPAPSAKELGAAGSLVAAEAAADRTAKALKALGLNVNFAPVADTGQDTRDFSSDPETVKKFVLAQKQGYEKNRMIYVLKHFPGIGRGKMDSHEEISEITASKEEMAASDLVPFAGLIDSAEGENYFILVSHLKYPAYDTENPANLSYAIETRLLREKLGFNGIIITDDMEMGAIAKHVPFRETAVRAVQAGADIVLVCHEYGHETEAYLGLLDAIEKGEIPMERIDASVRRIVRTKLLHSGRAEAPQ